MKAQNCITKNTGVSVHFIACDSHPLANNCPLGKGIVVKGKYLPFNKRCTNLTVVW